MTAATAPIDARRARIVCTLGPASSSPDTLAQMVGAGMDVARLNFSHGSHRDHARTYVAVREASRAAGRPVTVLADLQGPKIRLGNFERGPRLLEAGTSITLTRHAGGDAGTIPLHVEGRMAPGDELLIDDGRVKLCAESTEEGGSVRCRVIDGGMVSDHKGVNLPGLDLDGPRLTAKDHEDLRFALELGADAVALSFVETGDDARVARKAMADAGRQVPVLAKLERRQAVTPTHTLDDIVEQFDAVIVARGDLGVETPMEALPMLQKRVIAGCRRQAKPVIVATQMLESMVTDPRPTRAEVSDVANAVLDGADGVMLSAETSVGSHPVAAVSTMARVVAATEHGALGLRDVGVSSAFGYAGGPADDSVGSALVGLLAPEAGRD